MVTQKQRVVTQKNGTIEQTNNQNKTTRSVGNLILEIHVVVLMVFKTQFL